MPIIAHFNENILRVKITLFILSVTIPFLVTFGASIASASSTSEHVCVWVQNLLSSDVSAKANLVFTVCFSSSQQTQT
jgi:hypothetical protein